MREAEAFLAKVQEQQEEVAKALRDDQLRLSHTEDQIHKLTERLRSLQTAVAALQAEEVEKLDDRGPSPNATSSECRS